MIVKMNMIQMAAVSVLVLQLGKWIRNKVVFLDTYCVPAPVVGGLLFSLLALAAKNFFFLELQMDTMLQDFFMIAFFSTVGYMASIKKLKSSGKEVLFFLLVTSLLVVFQNLVGVFLANVFDLNPLMGLATGSIPMTGGHGTSASMAKVFEQYNQPSASTIAIAAATFGLVAGSGMGGPLASRLIRKHHLRQCTVEAQPIKHNEVSHLTPVTAPRLLSGMSAILIAMGLGTLIEGVLSKTHMSFPPYLSAMVAAALLRNISDALHGIELKHNEIEMLGNTFLSLFLSMALMGLKLWELADLALPFVVMLIGQSVLMAAFAYFITFNVMGRDYDAAVMAAGHCGFGMGATPNAIANMEVVTSKYGFSYKAFFIIPLVGSLFIDFINVTVISIFINLFN